MKQIDEMTANELSGYAKARGINLSGANTKAEKLAIIKQNEVKLIEVEVMGVRAAVYSDVADDFELLDWMDELNEGNGLLLPRIIKRMFGDDWNRIFEELKGGADRLSVEKAAEFFAEFFEQVAAKNS